MTTHEIIPGRTAALTGLVAVLARIVLAPLATIAVVAASDGRAALAALSSARTLAAFGLSLRASAIAASLDLVLGTTIAWALARQRFPGRTLLDALVEVPFALPTAVAGIALATLAGPHGWVGAPLLALGLRVAFTPLGVVVALTFVGLPFVVRADAHDAGGAAAGARGVGTLAGCG